jgi:hypothetical protein
LQLTEEEMRKKRLESRITALQRIYSETGEKFGILGRENVMVAAVLITTFFPASQDNRPGPQEAWQTGCKDVDY